MVASGLGVDPRGGRIGHANGEADP